MTTYKRIIQCACLIVWASAIMATQAASTDQGRVNQEGYARLVALYDEFLAYRRASQFGEEDATSELTQAALTYYPDYGSAAISARLQRVHAFQDSLEAIAVAGWSVPQRVDYLAVRSRLDQYEFALGVSRPWSRDPGFYVDRMRRPTFTSLPIDGDKLRKLQVELLAVSHLVVQAKANLTDVAADYADLALFNLSNSDGVGHGYPYRQEPPAGVIGWYADLLERAKSVQPILVPQIKSALGAVENFNAWLVENRATMNGRAGVGKMHFDWYLKHVKLMPWTTDDIVVLGERELDRLWSIYALAQHRNRHEPELELPASAEEYAQRLAEVDASIRAFLLKDEIITIPDYIGELDTNVPWIVRADGPNFWEQVQYRNPAPDHFHAVIPGHRFDAVLERNNTHPIRSRLTSGARAEGWATYLEEAMLEAGYDTHPRVRELIYVFGIFRAARVPADVWLQLNEMSVDEVVNWWLERVPYLDRDVARVDAEIYLRRPPGYGLGYTIGMLQMQRLLADRKRQLKDDFVLRDFHDQFMQAGRLPLSLVRWEMTGLDDEAKQLWPRQRLDELDQAVR